MPCSAEQLVGDSKIPLRQSIMRHVTEELYDMPINDKSEVAHLTTLMAKAIASYTNNEEIDQELLATFQEDFEGWTLNQFSNTEPEARKCLKKALRDRGIYLGPTLGHINKQLFELLTAKSLPDWNETELIRQVNLDPRSQFFQLQQQLIAKHDQNTKRELSTIGHTNISSIKFEPTIKETTSRKSPIPQEYFDFYHSLPVEGQYYGQEPLDLQTQTAFTRLYSNEDKYTGNVYDLLDDKVLLFFNICQAAGIKPSQFHIIFPRILADKARDFHLYHIPRTDDFGQQYLKIKLHFEHEIHRGKYFTDWTSTSFEKLRVENRDKSPHEILEILINKMQLCQRALGPRYMGDEQLRATIISACRGVPELEYAMMSPAKNCEQLFDQLRSSLEVRISRPTHTMVNDPNNTQSAYYVDRRYNENRKWRGGSQGLSRDTNFGKGSQGKFSSRDTFRGRGSFRTQGKKYNNRYKITKRCFVCNKEGCWSSNHSIEERKHAKQQYIIDSGTSDDSSYAQYLADYEGNELDGYIGEDDDDDPSSDSYEVMQNAGAYLTNAAFIHRLNGEDVFAESKDVPNQLFTIDDRYTAQVWQGIMPDSGASNLSTGGKAQFFALKREDPSVHLNTSNASQANIQFGPGKPVSSIGTVNLATAIGNITFHILNTPTPFLLCLKDMDNLKVNFNNITNELVQGANRIPVIRKWGHAWFHLRRTENACLFLTEVELKRLHRRFGHPAADRLHKLLTKAGHDDVDLATLRQIENFCHQCQTHGSAPRRFKFTLKDDHEFNYEVFIDVLYINGKPVLHVIDSATSFHGAKFLPSLSARDTFETFRMLWADTYLGPPDIVTHDAGTNFNSAEWRNDAKIMGITCKQIPTEAHWSIGKIERAHAPLRKVWDILYSELSSFTSEEAILQMAVKALNDTMGPDGLVPTLLVFGAYPRMNIDSPPSQQSLKRGEAAHKAMIALRKLNAARQINEALSARNGPDDGLVLSLPLRSQVLVWRENKGWKGPYKIAAIQGHDITVDMTNGPVNFRSTHVRPYKYQEHMIEPESSDQTPKPTPSQHDSPPPLIQPEQPRRRGRPQGSRNKAKAIYLTNSSDTFLSKKELNDRALSIKLRAEGIIKTPGLPFEASDKKEIDQLCERGVFEFIKYDPNGTHKNIRLFKSRMVREVKGKNENPYEKSRLVIAGHNDADKSYILTQSPTIKRVSQRLLIAIAVCLQESTKLELRDITQAYPQSQTVLQRYILAQLPPELQKCYPPDTVLHVIKPLYGVAESGVHWFTTYQKHHINNLNMVTSTFDPCLLITNEDNPECEFGIVGMQTDDTLIVASPAFSSKEQKEIDKANFDSKEKQILSSDVPLHFNGCTVAINEDTGSIRMHQKGQGLKLRTVDILACNQGQQYLEQRARGAYIASICQPEASYDLSVAAQAQQPTNENVAKLNARLQWQMDNPHRGLNFVSIDLSTAKVMVFTDGSFANNSDMSSQIGYVIMLVNEVINKDTFDIKGNILHYSSTKCKRVTRSVLASEIYGIVNGFDLGLALITTLKAVTKSLRIKSIPLIICTDSFSLYQCLTKLGTLNEKRLMIDVMSLRQSYERREIEEIRWINGADNPADAMTKSSPNKALTKFIDSNTLTIRIDGSVDRPSCSDEPI